MTFYADQYDSQATEKDDHADADHLYDTTGADGKGNDLQSKFSCKKLIIWTVNQIVNGYNTVYITKSKLKKALILFIVQQLRSLPKLGERIECVKQ